MALGPCPGENTLLDYAGGLLDEAEVDRLDQHVDACPSCRGALGRWLRTEGPSPEPGATPLQGGTPAGGAGAPEVGRGTLLDRYVLLKPLGAGGMGLVFTAYDPLLDRTVAIKVLRHEVASAMPDSVRVRTLREARAMARLTHPNVVAVHDAGLYQGRVFLAMEHLEGGNLAEWLKARRRTWKEIRDVFVKAGRGLAAAHGAGLVHRDFKPQNVLFGAGGRVLISDFGLVRPAGQTGPEPSSSPGPASPAPPDLPEQEAMELGLTTAGMVVGTPGYIAPESHRGEPADARADQYSFCAALHLGLYGKLPGRSTNHPGFHGCVPARVPEWLARLVNKGLSDEPAARYLTMDRLLEELSSRDLRLKRRAIGAAAVATALAAGSGLAAFTLRAPPPCRDHAERLARAWGPEARAAVGAGFQRSGVAVAPRSWEHLQQVLDQYAADWDRSYVAACRAPAAGPQTFVAVTWCLDLRIEELGALVRVLSSPTSLMVREDAARAAGELPPPQLCSGTARLALPPPPPAEVAGRVQALRQSLGEAWALYRAGDYPRGASAAEALVTQARDVRYPLVLAETLALAGRLRARLGRFKEATSALKEATLAAVTAGDEPLAAELCAETANVLVQQTRLEAAEEWLDHGDALLARLGDSPRLEASLLQARAGMLAAAGHWREAAARQEQAARLTEQVFGPDHPRTAAVLLSLSKELKAPADADRAQALALRGQGIYEAIYGPDHPDSVSALRALGQLARDRGNYVTELELARRVLDSCLATYGPESFEVAKAHWSLGNALSNLGDWDRALSEWRRTLATFESAFGGSGEMDAQIAALHQNIGDTHFELGEDEQAAAAFRRELELQGRLGQPLFRPLSGLGMTLAASGRRSEAMASFERAVSSARAQEAFRAEVNIPYEAMARAQYDAGRFREARESLQAALPFLQPLYSSSSTLLAVLTADIAAADLANGQVDRALAEGEPALEVLRRMVGLEYPVAARALATVGEAHRRKGHLDHAIPLLEQAVHLREQYRCRPIQRGETFLFLAEALSDAGRSPERAQELFAAARAEFLRSGATFWIARVPADARIPH